MSSAPGPRHQPVDSSATVAFEMLALTAVATRGSAQA
jgi:hypothetical protein